MKTIAYPTLVLHGEDDQIVPQALARATADLLPHAQLKTYPCLAHGMPTTHPEIINADILQFIRS